MYIEKNNADLNTIKSYEASTEVAVLSDIGTEANNTPIMKLKKVLNNSNKLLVVIKKVNKKARSEEERIE